MRRANIMILTLIACAMLALILVAGAEVASLRTATRQNQIAGLQMEQLYRTALAETMDELNASAEMVSLGRVLLSDTPIEGQSRSVSVKKVDGNLVDLAVEVRLADGGRRTHKVRLYALPLEERFGFSCGEQALYYNADRGLSERWYVNHSDEDLIIICNKRSGHVYSIAGGGETTLKGSVVVRSLKRGDFRVVLKSALKLEGNAVFEDDLKLESNLICKTAWIDGTLTFSDNARLVAENVYLGEDVSTETLAQIEAEKVYMPNPPEKEETEEAETSASDGSEILPLTQAAEEEASQTQTQRICYLMLQQLE